MDDFERELAESLRRQAGRAPHFEADYGVVQRRGRTRRWAVRGAGAFGALVLMGAGVAVWSNLEDGAATTEVATDFTPTVVAPTPTPTPSPTPIQPVITIPTPPVASVEPENPDAANLIVATGWGVGLVKDTGDQYAPVVCCQDNELRWWDQPGQPFEGGVFHAGAVTARDDLAGGLVTATRSALQWIPQPALGTGEGQLIQAVPSHNPDDEAPETQWLDLWDVAVNGDETQVLYSMVQLDPNLDFGGTVTLLAATLGDDVVTSEELESFAWTSADEDWYHVEGASWLPGGGWMTLKSHDDGSCSWIDFGPTDAAVDLESPFPRPDDVRDCPHRTLEAASLDDAGEVVAVSEVVEGREELAMYRLSDGATVNRAPLPPTGEEQGRWTEIDFGADAVLISRGEGMTPEAWPTIDETVLIGRDDSDVSLIAYVGSVSWPRAVISTEGLEALDPRGELWFGARVEEAGEDDGQPATEQTPEETTAADPSDPTPEPRSEPTPKDGKEQRIRNRDRRPAGRGNNVASSSAMVGTDGCAGTADQGVCAGWEFSRASAALDAAFGNPEQTDDPDTFVEGEPHPAGTHVWVNETRRVTLEVIDDTVVHLSVAPENTEGMTSPFSAELTVGDVLATLGSPTEIFQGSGEGSNVLTLSYETEAGDVHYSFVELWSDSAVLEDHAGPLEAIPESYDDLPVVAYSAQSPT